MTSLALYRSTVVRGLTQHKSIGLGMAGQTGIQANRSHHGSTLDFTTPIALRCQPTSSGSEVELYQLSVSHLYHRLIQRRSLRNCSSYIGSDLMCVRHAFICFCTLYHYSESTALLSTSLVTLKFGTAFIGWLYSYRASPPAPPHQALTRAPSHLLPDNLRYLLRHKSSGCCCSITLL